MRFHRTQQGLSDPQITKEDLKKIPLSVIESDFVKSEISSWLGDSYHSLDIISTHRLIRSAVKMSQEGLGHALCLNTDVDTNVYNTLRFIPLKPWCETSNNLIWKKNRTFSKATELFLKRFDQRIQETFYNAINTDAAVFHLAGSEEPA